MGTDRTLAKAVFTGETVLILEYWSLKIPCCSEGGLLFGGVVYLLFEMWKRSYNICYSSSLKC